MIFHRVGIIPRAVRIRWVQPRSRVKLNVDPLPAFDSTQILLS